MPGWGAIRNNTINSLRHYSEKMARLQEQAASGMRVIRASDAPTDAFRIMNLQTERQSFETYSKNLQTVTFNMRQISESIQQISSEISRAKTLATQTASGTYNAENRRLAAMEIDAILESSASLVNSKSMGRYVFGGSNLSDAPFEISRNDGAISNVRYVGASSELSVEISPGIDYRGTVVGGEFSKSKATGSASLLASNTGSAIGSGTPSARGDLWLTVAHDTTAYSDPGAATGIIAGSTSPANDTIIGDHTLTISTSGSNNLISLDGGPAFSFTNETNLRLVNDNGDEVYVDVSSWTGVMGAVDLAASGKASIDGGLTNTNIDLTSTNQAISSAGGSTMFVNFTNTQRAGADPIRVEGSYDLFGTLIHLRDTLLNDDDALTFTQQSEVLGETLDSLSELQAGALQHLTSVGAGLQALEGLEVSLDNLKYNAATEQSKLQDADIVEVATDLANTQTFYEMILASSSKLLSMSLLDYI